MTQSYRLPAASRKRSTQSCSITAAAYGTLPLWTDGQADKDIEEYIIETLLKALFKFRFEV